MAATGQRKSRKIGLICSAGGHLTDMLGLLPAFDGADLFLVTIAGPGGREKELAQRFRVYGLPPIGLSPMCMLRTVPRAWRILRSERPDVIVSTGSEIALPFFLLAKLTHTRSIYVECWCSVESRSGTGRLVYPLADAFFVQWPQLRSRYGPKARYEGGPL
jgi:UDP-N-acetylglucosamine:LPS N-acetylglucosamine transferase